MTQAYVIYAEDFDRFDVPQHEGAISRELVNRGRGSEEVVVRLTNLEPGGQDYWHVHESSEQLLLVRSGDGTIRISEPEEESDHETHALGPETFVYLPRDADHQVKNTGDDMLELVAVWAPPYESLGEWNPEHN